MQSTSVVRAMYENYELMNACVICVQYLRCCVDAATLLLHAFQPLSKQRQSRVCCTNELHLLKLAVMSFSLSLSLSLSLSDNIHSLIAKIVYREDMATALSGHRAIAYKAYKLPPKWAPASNANLAHVHDSWREVPREFVYWCEIPQECVADIKKVR